ncbi:hypothetical protein CEXT_52141 [Caerostris extrusa]|uniref:Uncharacterized protein n=1 Tax=Caerostris extrusa TaxID=172846 RepID=A0AAV4M668_CAEEX|nr:hypothetical protein CEXT_52141 [Caerostris extrusa]
MDFPLLILVSFWVSDDLKIDRSESVFYCPNVVHSWNSSDKWASLSLARLRHEHVVRPSFDFLADSIRSCLWLLQRFLLRPQSHFLGYFVFTYFFLF